MDRRGIVISPQFQILPNGAINFGSSPDPFDLRKYLMYWDEIDYPTSNLVHVESSSDIQYLEETKHLKRTVVQFSSANIDEKFFISTQEAAYRENNSKEPSTWSMAQLSSTQCYTQQTSKIGVDFELYGMLPVPSENTPLNDILEFKELRKDELSDFRAHLDEIYQKIISSSDIPRAKSSEISKLELAVKNIDKTLNESAIRRKITNLRNTINDDFLGIAGTGLGAASLASQISMTPLLAGMAGAGIFATIKSLSMPSSSTCSASFNYLNSIRNNFN